MLDKTIMDVAVCICTFRRTEISAALSSVANQLLSDDVSLRLMVIDNDDTSSALSIVERFIEETGIEVAYRHAPAANISLARNAALDFAGTEWLAFLDDDEIASRCWLNNLIAARHGAAAIFGPCKAIYDAQTPKWIRDGDYHSTILDAEKQTTLLTGHAGNVLINMDFVRKNKIKFDIGFGNTGGEDTMLFREMYERGGVLRYAPNAIIYEPVSPSRCNVRWIIQRRYRSGQIHGAMLYRFDRQSYYRLFLTGPAKVICCAFMLLALGLVSARALRWLSRGAFHLGTLSYAVGFETYPEYVVRS